MEIKVEVTTDIKALMDRLGDDVAAGMRAGMQNLVSEIEARAVKEAPVRTSHLVNSITSEVSKNGLQGIVRATARYAEYVHEGTGLFGPAKREIVILPKKKKALAWPGGRHPVKSVKQKGQKPNPFLVRAAANVDATALFAEGMMNHIRRKGW